MHTTHFSHALPGVFLALARAHCDPDVVWLQMFLLASLANELINR